MAPGVPRGVPQHRERDAGLFDEPLREGQIVLGADADDFESSRILSSELLECRGMSPAGRSMGRPEPEQLGGVGREQRSEVHRLAGSNVDHFDSRNVIGDCGRRLRLRR